MGPKDGQCPGEIYGMTVAGDVLPGLYESQAECSALHGCRHQDCPLQNRWRKRGRPGSRTNLWGFVVTALMGPRKP